MSEFKQMERDSHIADMRRTLREERERSDRWRRQCRNQEALIGKIPLEQRDKMMASMKMQERKQTR
jgi:hypothetical protein